MEHILGDTMDAKGNYLERHVAVEGLAPQANSTDEEIPLVSLHDFGQSNHHHFLSITRNVLGLLKAQTAKTEKPFSGSTHWAFHLYPLLHPGGVEGTLIQGTLQKYPTKAFQ